MTKAFVSRTAVPALLHTCRESRHEGLLTYTPMFTTDFSPICTYVSLDNDTITGADSILSYIREEELDRVQRLTLEVRDAPYFGHFHLDVLVRMSSLRELDLLAQQEIMDSWDFERRHPHGLKVDFGLARMKYPAWNYPRVRIMDGNTGKELIVIPGRAAPPE